MAKTVSRRARSSSGLPVDFLGGLAVDPTENVKDLSEALSQRQDDLRDLNNKYLNARIETLEVRIKNSVKMSRQESTHVAAIIALQMERLDKIRQVDVLNASVAAERVAEAVRTLAIQTATNQEANRNLVATSAAGLATQLTNLFAESNKRLSALELTSSAGAGKSVGISSMGGLILGSVTAVASLLAIAAVLYAVLKP
jgi:predicted metal-dependent hydrolase